MVPHDDIRIGTLVKAEQELGAHLRALLGHGFESFQITFWQDLGEIDLVRLAEDCQQALADSTARISSLAVFGNPLLEDEQGDRTRAAWHEAMRQAHRFGCDLVCGFTGRLPDVPIPDNIERYRAVWSDLADRAAAAQLRIGFENCSMGGDWRRGTWNIAHNPDAWELMFTALDAPHLGLEWEPCHQLVQLIDPLPQLEAWMDRVVHLHGKDATVDSARLARHGILGGTPFCWHRHPGFGDTDWRRVIDILRLNGYRGSIDIEGWHDPVYRGPLEMTGQVHALEYLQHCRGGAFIPQA